MNRAASFSRGNHYNTIRITASRSGAAYQPANKNSYADEFYYLLKKWRYETLPYSFADEAIEHSAFQKIIALGKSLGDPILELIIEEIDKQPDFIIAALPLLTGEDPVSESDRGNLGAMAASWVQWWRNR